MKIKDLPLSDVLPCGACRFSDLSAILDCRAKSRIPENAKSVIVYLFPYYLGEEYYENSNISKYAVSENYHETTSLYLEKITAELREKFPENKFEYFCDNSPVKEVETAMMCGLGVMGRNSLFINRQYGSYCFIGEIITDAQFSEYSVREDRACLNCKICEMKCPGKAIENGRVNTEKCFSYISQKKGELSDWEKSLFDETDSIWGCDVCQNVCPMNKNIEKTPIKEFYETAKSRYSQGDEIEKRAFAWRGEKVIERNFKIKYCKDE